MKNFKAFLEESKAHDVLSGKLKDMNSLKKFSYPTPEERKAQKDKEEKKEVKESEELDERENQEHEFIKQSLADKDINSHIKDGKVVVHKDNATKAKNHLKKIGHGDVQVVHEGFEELEEGKKIPTDKHLALAAKHEELGKKHLEVGAKIRSGMKTIANDYGSHVVHGEAARWHEFAGKVHNDAAKAYRNGDGGYARIHAKSAKSASETANSFSGIHTGLHVESMGESFEEELDEAMIGHTTKSLSKHVKSLGWTLARTDGGHDVYKHPKSQKNLAIPRHAGELSRPTVKQMLKRAEFREGEEMLSFKEFITEEQLEEDKYMTKIEGGSGKGKGFLNKDVTRADHLSAMEHHSRNARKAMDDKRDSDARHHQMKYRKHKEYAESMKESIEEQGEEILDESYAKKYETAPDHVKRVADEMKRLKKMDKASLIKTFPSRLQVGHLKSEPKDVIIGGHLGNKFSRKHLQDHDKHFFGESVDVEEQEDLMEDLHDRLSSHIRRLRDAGHNVVITDRGSDGRSAKFVATDKEGNKKLHTVTMNSVKHEKIGGKNKEEDESQETQKRGRGRPVGSKSGARA